MTWQLLLPIIIEHGLPFAERLSGLITSNMPPTPADWAELRALSNQNAEDQMRGALLRSGISLTEQQAQNLLGLTRKAT